MATQDELIQAELDWTIEQLEAKEAQADEWEQKAEETQETVEQPTEEKARTETANAGTETATQKKDSVAKLLKQRNEARAEVEELKSKIQNTADLEAKVKELEESIASQVLEKEAQEEKEAFYNQYPNAKGHEEDIEKIRTEKDLSYSEAFQLYAAQNDPTLLMDEQYRNKTQSWATITWVAKTETTVKTPKTMEDFANMSDDDFLAWSDGVAQKERLAKWLLK